MRQKWPVATGTITRSEVIDGRIFRPSIHYTYGVNQQEFSGVTDFNVPYFGPSSARKEVAYITIANLQEGSSVNVYYDPQNPARSCLKTGPKWSEFTRISLGTFLCGAGVLGLFSVRRTKP